MSSAAPFRLRVLVLAVALAAAGDARVHAQGFMSPFLGYDFSGDSGCPSLTACEDRKLNAGVAFGKLGRAVGFEEEFSYARDFFGTTPDFDSSVMTLMSNVMVVPKIGPIRPYFLGGIGLIRTRVSVTAPAELTISRNSAAWDLGGGVIGLIGAHAGIRGDIRYFHSFEDLNLLGFELGSMKLDFGRASLGLFLAF